MKIAVLIDAWLPFLGGGQKSVLEITKILKKEKKADFVIFHSFSPTLFARFLWTIYIIPQFIFYYLFICRFDLIDARAFLAGFPGKILSIILRIPVIFTVNGCGSLDRKIAGISGWLEKWLLTGIKYHQQISDSQHFLKYKNVNKDILIIPNGVDIKEYEKVKVKKNNIFTIIYVGRLAKIKGLDYLLKAINLVKNKRKDFLAKLVGSGEEETVLKEFVSKNNLGRWVKFIGEARGKRLIREFKSSHLFILPSLAEGQPITLLEAWAAELPVVVTKVGSLVYYVKSQNGYLVPPADSQKMAETILKAMENKGLQQMGKHGFWLVKKRYTWSKTAQKYFSVYQKVLSLKR